VGLALIGLALVPARHRLVGVALLAVMAVSWYVNATVSDWWGGEAFGARRFVSCVPIFAVGLAALIDRLRWSPRAIALACAAVIAHAWLLLVQYQAFMKGLRDIAPYPDSFYGLWVARFVVPIEIVRWLWHRL
jgi:hypothetical protein